MATDASDRPQFSFLMYSSPEQRSEEGITSAPGGGVAHMLVAYDVPILREPVGRFTLWAIRQWASLRRRIASR